MVKKKQIAKIALALSITAGSLFAVAPTTDAATTKVEETVVKKDVWSLWKIIFSQWQSGSKQVSTGKGESDGKKQPSTSQSKDQSSSQPKGSTEDSATTDQNSNENQNNNSQSNTGSTEESGALADKIIATGEKYLSTPYEYGAKSGQTSTFDCSSFTQYVFKQNGIDLPRSSRQQSTVGTTVSKSQLKKGDLLFFTTKSSGGKIGHVGIYAGDNKILHTWGPGGVRYDSLSTGWLQDGFVTAKRVIPNGQ
jgi:cell wall-associated NlpC family hydrolase